MNGISKLSESFLRHGFELDDGVWVRPSYTCPGNEDDQIYDYFTLVFVRNNVKSETLVKTKIPELLAWLPSIDSGDILLRWHDNTSSLLLR